MGLQKHISGMSTLFPSAVIGMFFDVTFFFYTTRAFKAISSMKEESFVELIKPEKAEFLQFEILSKISPYIEELMLINGPLPPGAVSLPAERMFGIKETLIPRSNYGYALVTKISGDVVQVQYQNMKCQLEKQVIFQKFAIFVTDLTHAEASVDAGLLSGLGRLRI
jgi:hypothetical protein